MSSRDDRSCSNVANRPSKRAARPIPPIRLREHTRKSPVVDAGLEARHNCQMRSASRREPDVGPMRRQPGRILGSDSDHSISNRRSINEILDWDVNVSTDDALVRAERSSPVAFAEKRYPSLLLFLRCGKESSTHRLEPEE